MSSDAEILARYAEGQTQASIARALHVGRTRIARVAAQAGALRSRSGAIRLRYPAREGAFEVASPEARYWAGFILGDGCVLTPLGKSRTLDMGVAILDRGHLEALAGFLGLPPSRVRTTRDMGHLSARLSIRSERICSSLERYGVGPRKTGKEVIPSWLAGDRDYWRGIFDADGSLFFSGRNGAPGIKVTGGWEMAAAFARLVRAIYPRCDPKASFDHGAYTAKTEGWHAVSKVVRFLYADGDVALPRRQALVALTLKRYAEGTASGKIQPRNPAARGATPVATSELRVLAWVAGGRRA